MYKIASTYKYYQKTVAKTGHPAVTFVYYEMVLAAINTTCNGTSCNKRHLQWC